MRHTPNVIAERYRVHQGPLGSHAEYGNNGAFMVPIGEAPFKLRVIVSDGTEEGLPEDHRGWEHASVSTHNRCPTWEEMCFVKEMFWKDDEVVFQLHPAKEHWVNNHPYCLHLWRKTNQDPPLPPTDAVGWRALNPEEPHAKP